MRFYLLVMLIASVVTFATCFPVRKIATKVTRNELRARDVHTTPTPRIGGISMLTGMLAALGVATFLPVFQNEYRSGFEIQSVMIAGAFLCIIGVLDDIFNLDWMLKLAAQIIAATFVTFNGVQILSLPIAGITIGSNRISMVLTVFIIVAVINAINFIDGLDGLAAGVTAIGASAFLYYSLRLLSEQYNYAASACLIAAALIGICIGFLPHNWNPAKIFMGDTGSQLLGFMLACSALLVTGKIDETSANIHSIPAFMPLILPFLVCMLPLLDMIMAIIRRIIAKKSPFSPDRKHLHHRLLDLGHSHLGTVLLLYFWAAIFAFGGLLYFVLSAMTATLILAVVVAIVLIGTFAPKIFLTPIFEDAK
jgi:UDP-GlcNAc:undecaprenyl-phosphate GlcNAc-1-phosphate transferase